MTFVYERLDDSKTKVGEYRMGPGRICYLGRTGRPRTFIDISHSSFWGTPVLSREETEIRLAVMGLRRRRFPCDRHSHEWLDKWLGIRAGEWLIYGTEPDMPEGEDAK